MQPAPRRNAYQKNHDKTCERVPVNANKLDITKITSGNEKHFEPRNLATK